MTVPDFVASPGTDAMAVILLDALIKGIVLVAAAGLAGLALRRASAASRHLIGVLGMVGLVILPLLSAGLPRWRVAMLPASGVQRTETREEPLERREEAASGEDGTEKQPHPGTVGRRETLSQDVAVVEANSEESSSRPSVSSSADSKSLVASSSVDEAGVARPKAALSWTFWLSLLWAVGCIVVLGRWCVSRWSVVRLVRSSRTMEDGPWIELVERLRSGMRVGRTVRLVASKRAATPMTAGVIRPVIVVPVLSDAWSEQERRLVITHELAHIQRWDTLSQFVARLGCAIHWFNPAVWALGRWMQMQCEQAADDVVVAQGVPAADYAKSLVRFAQRLKRSAQPSGQAAMSIAPTPKSLLDRRITMILDSTQNRSGASRLSLAIGLAGLAALVVPLAVVQPAARATQDASTLAQQQNPEQPDERIPSQQAGSNDPAPVEGKFGKPGNVKATDDVPPGEVEDWSRYEGFNRMTLEQQRALVARDLEQMRARYRELNFRAELSVSTETTLLGGDPFLGGSMTVVPYKGRYPVKFLATPNQIKVESSDALVSDERVQRHKRFFSLTDGIAQTLYFRDGKPTKLVRECDDIRIQEGHILAPFLAVTRPKLAAFGHLSVKGVDELSQAIQYALEFELRKAAIGPDEIVMKHRSHVDSPKTRTEVFELADYFRWVQSGSVMKLFDKQRIYKRSRTIDYRQMGGVEVPSSWTVANWKERMGRPGQPSQMIRSSFSEWSVVLEKLETPDQIPDSEFTIERPEGVRLIDRCPPGTSKNGDGDAAGSASGRK